MLSALLILHDQNHAVCIWGLDPRVSAWLRPHHQQEIAKTFDFKLSFTSNSLCGHIQSSSFHYILKIKFFKMASLI